MFGLVLGGLDALQKSEDVSTWVAALEEGRAEALAKLVSLESHE